MSTDCRERTNAYARAYHWRNREAQLERMRQYAPIRRAKRHGLTVDEMNRLLKVGCAICGVHIDLVIDHNHETGEVRAALCRTCNVGIGQFHDDPQLVRIALDYLERYQ